MVDYEFYTGTYLGSLIPEKAFPAFAARAGDYLARLGRICQVESTGADSQKMALCAVAEAAYGLRRRQGVRTATVGGVSVSYDPDSMRRPELYEAARTYLDIRRGVGP